MKNYLRNLKKKKKGFTLIELIIVLAIITIISAIAIPKFGSIQKNAKITTDKANAKTIANAAASILTSGEIQFTMNSGSRADTYIIMDPSIADTATVFNKSNYDAMSKYLQTVPVPKYENDKVFVVGIKTDDTITVYIEKKNVTPPTNAVFPAPTSGDYKD